MLTTQAANELSEGKSLSPSIYANVMKQEFERLLAEQVQLYKLFNVTAFRKQRVFRKLEAL
jgi:hypothetical protein